MTFRGPDQFILAVYVQNNGHLVLHQIIDADNMSVEEAVAQAQAMRKVVYRPEAGYDVFVAWRYADTDETMEGGSDGSEEAEDASAAQAQDNGPE